MCDPQLEHPIYYSSRVGDVKVRSVIYPRLSSYICKKKDAKASENSLNMLGVIPKLERGVGFRPRRLREVLWHLC